MTPEDNRDAGRSAILILGMHRSGTSALAGVLAELGCKAPLTPIEAGRQNRNGFFESRPVARLDDSILEASGSSWLDWRPVGPGTPGALSSPEFRDSAAALIADEFAGADRIVLKDPRMCRLVPVWLDALGAADYRPLIVLTHRSPLEVAQSLRVRNGFPLAFGVLLWLRHVIDAERLSRGHPRCVTSYDRLLADWRGVVADLDRGLGLALGPVADEAAERVEAFLSGDLRHFAAPPGYGMPDPDLMARAEACHAILERWAAGGEDAGDHAALDAIDADLTALGWAYVAPRSVTVEGLEQRLEAARAQVAGLEGQLSREADRRSGLERQIAEAGVAREKAAGRYRDLEAREQGLVDKVAGEAARRGVLERALAAVQGHLQAMADWSREGELERDRQVRELGAMAGLLREADRRRETDREEIKRLTGRVSKLKGDLVASQRAHEAAEARFREIVASSSWRITGPFRRVIRGGQRILRVAAPR